jgi:hypothetical protein
MTGEHLSADVRQLVRLLHAHKVRYLLVGGEAVIHHGYPRLTGDVDFFYEPTAKNARRLFAALEEFWGGSVPAVSSAQDLLEPGVVIQFGRPPSRIDLISNLGSVSFQQAWRGRARQVLTVKRKKVPLPIIGLEDLLRSKRDAGRHKDLEDVEALVAVREASARQRKTRRPK